MTVLTINRKRIYIPSDLVNVTISDLWSEPYRNGSITDAYFFKSSGSQIFRTKFDRGAIDNRNCKLMVEANGGEFRNVYLSIAGLTRIVDFICEFDCFGKDLSLLRGKPIKAYFKGGELIGISKN